jgi:hypothetical protein
MSRYKGQLRSKRTELEFPHHVDIVIPPGGLGTRLDAMYDFTLSKESSRSAGTASTVPMARSFASVSLMRV